MSAQKSAGIRTLPLTACLFATAIAFILLFEPSTAWAHKVNVFGYAEGDMVITESYFSDGGKCRDSTIEVFDTQGNKLLDGKTDAEGRFSFRVPTRTDLLIRLTASMGHQAEYTIPAADLSESLPAAPEAIMESAESLSEEAAPTVEPVDLPTREIAAPVDIEQVVERVVARQLAPIRRALEESQNKQRFSDIVGGIGYIIGLMGLALYFYSRQRRG